MRAVGRVGGECSGAKQSGFRVEWECGEKDGWEWQVACSTVCGCRRCLLPCFAALLRQLVQLLLCTAHCCTVLLFCAAVPPLHCAANEYFERAGDCFRKATELEPGNESYRRALDMSSKAPQVGGRAVAGAACVCMCWALCVFVCARVW